MSLIIVGSDSPSATFKGISVQEDFSFSILETPLVTGGTTNTIQIQDANVLSTTGAGVSNNYQIFVNDSLYDGIYLLGHSLNAINPAIATVNNNGNVTRIANGVASIDIITPVGTRRYTRTMSNSGTTSQIFSSWITGSLAKHIDDNIRTLVSGKSPGSTTQLFLTSNNGNISSPNVIRNSSLFTGMLDLTSISIMRTGFTNEQFPVVLISPRHVISGHVGLGVGNQVVFKDSSNTYQTRTISNTIRIDTGTGEHYISLLDSAINSITPMSFLPSTWRTKLPSLGNNTWTLQVLNKGFTAGHYIRVLESYGVSGNQLNLRKSTDSTLFSWSSDIIGGDSNGPTFVPINGVPVLLDCMNYSNGGTMYSDVLTSINSIMASLLPSPLYTATTVDLSGFNTY